MANNYSEGKNEIQNELKIFLKLEVVDDSKQEFTTSHPEEVEILIENYLRTN